MTYKEALSLAQQDAMTEDPSVFIYGLDVPDFKAIFGSVKSVQEHFDSHRYFGTPLSEDAMTGVALGAALMGLRPVHIHIRVDFLLLAMNQLINMISVARYMSGGQLKVPILIRAVIGKGWGQSCQHSKSLQSFFAHIPGIKVIMPATVQDAYSMTLAAIRDDNPVVSLEHRLLYDIEGPVVREHEQPLCKVNMLKTGSDLTLITTSWMAVEGIKAAEILERLHNVKIDVVDVCSIQPLDRASIIQSARKTGRVVIADYDWDYCGFSAELSALIYEECFM
jgi:pyruvate dehydrogenase E1 component beta subunit